MERMTMTAEKFRGCLRMLFWGFLGLAAFYVLAFLSAANAPLIGGGNYPAEVVLEETLPALSGWAAIVSGGVALAGFVRLRRADEDCTNALIACAVSVISSALAQYLEQAYGVQSAFLLRVVGEISGSLALCLMFHGIGQYLGKAGTPAFRVRAKQASLWYLAARAAGFFLELFPLMPDLGRGLSAAVSLTAFAIIQVFLYRAIRAADREMAP